MTVFCPQLEQIENAATANSTLAKHREDEICECFSQRQHHIGQCPCVRRGSNARPHCRRD